VSIQVIHDAFRRGVHDVTAATSRLEADKSSIDARVGGFLAAGWTGVAADSFVDAWDEWKAAAEQVQQGLEAMGQLLDATQRDFVDQDGASEQSLDQISRRIIDRLG